MSRRKSGKKSRGSTQSGKKPARQKTQALVPRAQPDAIPEARSANDIELAAEGLIARAACEKAAGVGEIPWPGDSADPGSDRAEKRKGRDKGQKAQKAGTVETGRGIGPAVFLPCLFMALILGIYLGTLLPDMYARYSSKAPAPAQTAETVPQMPPQMPPPPMPQQAKPAQNSIDGSIAGLVSRTTLNPGDVNAWIELGNRYFDTHQPAKSIEAYKRALELEPQNADVLTDLGIMYREAGDYEAAVQSFRKARQVDPRHANSMFNEGVVLLNDLKRPGEARQAWQRLLDVNPEARSPDGKRVADMVRLIR